MSEFRRAELPHYPMKEWVLGGMGSPPYIHLFSPFLHSNFLLIYEYYYITITASYLTPLNFSQYDLFSSVFLTSDHSLQHLPLLYFHFFWGESASLQLSWQRIHLQCRTSQFDSKSVLNLLQYCFCFMFWFFDCEASLPNQG